MIERLTRRFVTFCFALALAACAASTASADPLAITSGRISGCPSCIDEVHGGTFFGGGFTFSGSTESIVAQRFANSGGVVSGSSSIQFGGFGVYTAVINGNTYYINRESFLRFTTAEIVLPPGPAATVLNITVPFTLSGQLLLTDDIARRNPPTFSFQLSGQGLAHIRLVSSGGGTLYQIQNISYDFGDPATVPEPATATLLGAGLAAALLRQRRRRRRGRRDAAREAHT